MKTQSKRSYNNLFENCSMTHNYSATIENSSRLIQLYLLYVSGEKLGNDDCITEMWWIFDLADDRWVKMKLQRLNIEGWNQRP